MKNYLWCTFLGHSRVISASRGTKISTQDQWFLHSFSKSRSIGKWSIFQSAWDIISSVASLIMSQNTESFYDLKAEIKSGSMRENRVPAAAKTVKHPLMPLAPTWHFYLHTHQTNPFYAPFTSQLQYCAPRGLFTGHCSILLPNEFMWEIFVIWKSLTMLGEKWEVQKLNKSL